MIAATRMLSSQKTIWEEQVEILSLYREASRMRDITGRGRWNTPGKLLKFMIVLEYVSSSQHQKSSQKETKRISSG